MKPHEYIVEISTAFKKRDAKKLRKLHEAILREASLAYSKKLYYITVMAYVLSKVMSKSRFTERRFKERVDAIETALDEISMCKEEECQEEKFKTHFTKLEDTIKHLEAEDPRFVIDLLSKGRLKVAATLYAQGISLGMASEITGIEKQEILSYAGHTMMFDRIKEEKTVNDRLKALRIMAEG